MPEECTITKSFKNELGAIRHSWHRAIYITGGPFQQFNSKIWLPIYQLHL